MKKENQPGTLTIENSNPFRPSPLSATALHLPLLPFATTTLARRSLLLGPASLALLSTVVTGMTALAQTESQRADGRMAVQLMAQATAAQPMTYEEVERLYLEGKISAKRYQELLSQIQRRPASTVPTIQPPPQTPAPPAPLVIPAAPQAAPRATTSPPPVAAPPSAATSYSELERLYLSGRISAEQYQQMLSDLQAGRAPVPVVTQPVPTPEPAPRVVGSSDNVAVAAPQLEEKPRNHAISFSGDFLYGQGKVTMPFNFSLQQFLPSLKPQVGSPPRSSDYLGATVSYSFGRAWYFDVSFAHGTSSGNADVPLGGSEPIPSKFTIDDNWYQAYVRYTFQGLRRTKFRAYVRAGFSYVTADLTDETVIPALGLYSQNDKTEDILGNLGFGVRYFVYTFKSGAALSLQVEGEGFYGHRSQDSQEVLPAAGFSFPVTKIDNDLYGGIGRVTARFDYSLGRSAFKLFADGGVQGKFTMINYSGLGSFDELLWGPYAKVGLSYSF